MMSLAKTGVIASQINPHSSSAPSALPLNQAATRPFGVPTRIKAWTEAVGRLLKNKLGLKAPRVKRVEALRS